MVDATNAGGSRTIQWLTRESGGLTKAFSVSSSAAA
jgi:hypothetical protein